MYYSYLWLREDGTPFYVGKGKGKRAFCRDDHRALPPPRERIILQEFDTEEEAFIAEVFFIEVYGRKDLGTGCLINLTSGGENPPNSKGVKRGKSTRKKMSKWQKGKKLSESHIENLTKVRRARTLKIAVCHPDRKHKAKGFCSRCYRHFRYCNSTKEKT